MKQELLQFLPDDITISRGEGVADRRGKEVVEIFLLQHKKEVVENLAKGTRGLLGKETS